MTPPSRPFDLEALERKADEAMERMGEDWQCSDTSCTFQPCAEARLLRGAAAYIRQLEQQLESVQKFLGLATKPEDLPEDAAKILRDNLWQLYGDGPK